MPERITATRASRNDACRRCAHVLGAPAAADALDGEGEAKESGVVPLPEHQIRWKPGVLCGAPQGYIGPDNLAVYTPRRYDPVCNMTQVVVGVSGSSI